MVQAHLGLDSVAVAKIPAKRWEYSSAELTGQDKGGAKSYKIGSRHPRPPDPLAFWRRYSA
jgi:hypothetical protein